MATTNPLSVSVDLSIMVISCKWNHTISDPLCLASLAEHNFFKVHQYFSKYWRFFPFYCQIILYYRDIPHVFCLSDGELFLSCFQFDYSNNAVMNICLHFFMWTYISTCQRMRYILQSK